MRDLSADFILSGTLNAQENTWKGRYNSTVPSIKLVGQQLELSANNANVVIDSFDEIVLTIVLKFLFSPVWLVKQFYQTWKIAEMETPESRLNRWVDIGLVWKENSVTGQYIRPTYLLFKLFGQDPRPFFNIPFNSLTHTVSEQKVMFEIMSGNSSVNNICRDKLLPRISELGFDDDPFGTNVLTEPDFRNPKLFKESGIAELSETENQINIGMKNGATVTPELVNFNQFTLVKKVNNTGTVKKDYQFHVPDLIVPTVRVNGVPQSIAVEVELSNKRWGYEETMRRYRDNNKFGTVCWLCNTPAIAEALRNAYDAVGGTGSCKTVLMEFVIPSPEF